MFLDVAMLAHEVRLTQLHPSLFRCFASAGRVNVTSYTGQNATIAAAMAVGADFVVVNVAVSSSEGSDRTDLSLPQWQNDLVYAALAANPNTVVVARCPGECDAVVAAVWCCVVELRLAREARTGGRGFHRLQMTLHHLHHPR